MLPAEPWDFLIFAALGCAGSMALARLLRFGPRRWLVAFSLLLAALVAGWFSARQAGRAAAREIERLVGALGPTYARELEALGHADLPSDVAPDDPRYLRMIEAEKRWLAANPNVADIYTFRRRADGRFVLWVDSETDYDHDGVYRGERESRTPIGELYTASPKELARAFAGETIFDAIPDSDRWGTWVSALVPMRDSHGAVEAVLGVDYDAGLWQRAISRARSGALAAVTALLAGALIAIAAVARARRDAETLADRNRELRAARDEALAASRAKSSFLAAVSHELRTPLHVFLGMNELLLASELEPRERRHAETAQQAAEGLLTMVGDLLDYAQLEAGKLSLDEGAFELGLTIAEGVADHRLEAERRHLELRLEAPRETPVWLTGDSRRLRQILRHLLSNAIKYTEQGEVWVSWRVLPAAGDRVEVELGVADTGIGVPADQSEAIFERFRQLDASNTRRHGGIGIGLALSRALAVLLGGTLEVQPAPERGSVFRLRVPMRRADVAS